MSNFERIVHKCVTRHHAFQHRVLHRVPALPILLNLSSMFLLQCFVLCQRIEAETRAKENFIFGNLDFDVKNRLGLLAMFPYFPNLQFPQGVCEQCEVYQTYPQACVRE